jgi:EAL domain-containing protein (putative c-di-GMP-specific phosphodiesterase class I)
MGVDEFTVVLCNVGDSQQIEKTAQNILDSMSAAFQIGSEQVFVSASVGLALYPQNATLVEELLKHADQALYVAKGAGRNRFSFFTPALQEAAVLRARLAADLRLALPEQQFALVYQPIVHLPTGKVHKAEALLRWLHPQRGPVSPAQFIPIAESTGLIVEIGEWVFQQAALQVAQWQAAYGRDFQISVNKSPVQFHRRDTTQASWSAHLRSMNLAGSSIAVEITEGLLLDTNEHVARQLEDLRSCGIAISLDDFGTGYSSLTYLQKIAIDYIKIDQSFVRNLKAASADLAVCNAIIRLAHDLGMQVVAEGVETAEQRDLLVAAGCDFGQGYWFAKPMLSSAFEDFMRNVHLEFDGLGDGSR